MKKVAYIFSRQHTGELIEDSIFLSIAAGEHDVEVVSMYFVEDGVYQLVKGGRSSKNLKTINGKHHVKIFACKLSIKNRNLQNIIIDGVQIGDFRDFFKTALEADHILSF